MKKIKKIKNKQIWINTLCILLFFCIVLADFNGATLHNIKGEELEQYFLQSLSVNDDSQKDSVIKKQKVCLWFYTDKNGFFVFRYNHNDFCIKKCYNKRNLIKEVCLHKIQYCIFKERGLWHITKYY